LPAPRVASTEGNVFVPDRQEKVMRILHLSLDNHNKRRCNNYLSLMYLMMLAGEPQERIASLNCVSLETARESNPIANCFAALFKAYRSRARSGPGEYVPH